jgi:hypothetical protein
MFSIVPDSGRSARRRAAGSSGAVQALRMENDAPVVGPDAPTANSKMVKLDIATADWSRPTSGLRVIQTNKDISACKGALIGAALGAGAGTAGAAYTGEKEIVLPAESALCFKLTEPLTVMM